MLQKKANSKTVTKGLLEWFPGIPEPRGVIRQHWECSGTVLCHQVDCGDPARTTRYWSSPPAARGAQCSFANKKVSFFATNKVHRLCDRAPRATGGLSSAPCGRSNELRDCAGGAQHLMIQHCPRTLPVLPVHPPRRREGWEPTRSARRAQAKRFAFLCVTDWTNRFYVVTT